MHTTPHPYHRPTACWTTHRNRQDLTFWTRVTPDDDADIDTTTSHLATRTGSSKTTTLTWLSIVQLLRHYPALRAHNHDLGLLDHPRLRAIEHALIAVDDPDIITEVDKHLTTFLTPTKAAETLPGPTTIRRFLRHLLVELDPPAAEHDTHPHALGIHVRTTGTGHTQIQAILAADDALEIHTILRATATAEDTTLHDALLGVLRGTMHSPKVVYNLYGPHGGTPTYLAGTGYLDDRQARRWAERITHTRNMDTAAHATTLAYRPTEEIIRAVKGRDGTCRGPEDCGIDAEACDVDHVLNHTAGGPTTPSNLQCLCRRHHLMKTRGDLNLVMDAQGVCSWVYPDGDVVVTHPRGPLSRPSKLFAQSFMQRRAQRVNKRRTAPTPEEKTREEEPPF